jgi:hypothetical protein
MRDSGDDASSLPREPLSARRLRRRWVGISIIPITPITYTPTIVQAHARSQAKVPGSPITSSHVHVVICYLHFAAPPRACSACERCRGKVGRCCYSCFLTYVFPVRASGAGLLGCWVNLGRRELGLGSWETAKDWGVGGRPSRARASAACCM